MRIYNSLSRRKEEFAPIDPPNIKIYVCGPTVYDCPHIGHARSAYIFDVIRNYLEYPSNGYKVTFIRNVTDVDDKIIDKAKKELKGEDLNSAVKKISQKYLDIYRDDMALLGIGTPDEEPKATEYIDEMKKFIMTLIEKGCAYEANGDIYFDIKKARDYGKLSNQNLEKMEIGARVEPGERKKDPLDFALWKKAKEDEPSWSSPLGLRRPLGRPGWHIECSVMSSEILGDEFDIHGGGIDLIFPHHENEIAQSEGAGKKFARIWMHNGLLTINGEKMAKSLGNFISIKDFLATHGDPDYLKLLFLSTHYRHPVDYSEEKIEEMKKKKERILIFLNRADEALRKYKGKKKSKIEMSDRYQIHFIGAMNDDFNTPLALSVIFKCIEDGNKLLDKETLSEEDYMELCNSKLFIEDLAKNIFNLNFSYKKILGRKLLSKIMEREKARENKDFKKADAIRKQLLEEGIIIEDTKEGPIWRRRL